MPELPEVRERIAAAIHGSDYGRTCSSCLKRADAVLDVLNPKQVPDPSASGEFRMARWAMFAAFVATVYGANWALGRYGIVPIGFGLSAPAGVYFAGLAFGLRDALDEAAGRRWVLAAILTGAGLSYALEDAVQLPGGHAAIAVASAVAFGLSELADLAVYAPLRRRSWPAAVVLSNVVGSVVDSALFLWLAFGSLDHIEGQVVGKTYMTLLALPIVWLLRRRREQG